MPRGKGPKPKEKWDNALVNAVTARDRDTISMVREALIHREVKLAFQPVVMAKGNAVAFHEALLRVLDATGRVIPARDFINAVQDTEIGRDLDCLALESSLSALRRNPDIRLSVNMSARSIGNADWTRVLQRAVKGAPELAHRLILEITEPSLMQVPEVAADFMADWRDRGVAFALDDYGAGLTSWDVFRDFRFDVVKLGAAFTRGITCNPERAVLTGTIASLCQQLNIHSVATRVESLEEARALAGLGLTCLQGFAFGAPTMKPPWAASAGRRAA